jgi:hypothetical protein
MKREFSLQILEKTQISSFIKIRPAGAELFYVDGLTDGRTDMMKLLFAFPSFANASKNNPKIQEGSR